MAHRRMVAGRGILRNHGELTIRQPQVGFTQTEKANAGHSDRSIRLAQDESQSQAGDAPEIRE